MLFSHPLISVINAPTIPMEQAQEHSTRTMATLNVVEHYTAKIALGCGNNLSSPRQFVDLAASYGVQYHLACL